jgi:hypothetical protein
MEPGGCPQARGGGSLIRTLGTRPAREPRGSACNEDSRARELQVAHRARAGRETRMTKTHLARRLPGRTEGALAERASGGWRCAPVGDGRGQPCRGPLQRRRRQAAPVSLVKRWCSRKIAGLGPRGASRPVGAIQGRNTQVLPHIRCFRPPYCHWPSESQSWHPLFALIEQLGTRTRTRTIPRRHSHLPAFIQDRSHGGYSLARLGQFRHVLHSDAEKRKGNVLRRRSGRGEPAPGELAVPLPDNLPMSSCGLRGFLYITANAATQPSRPGFAFDKLRPVCRESRPRAPSSLMPHFPGSPQNAGRCMIGAFRG